MKKKKRFHESLAYFTKKQAEIVNEKLDIDKMITEDKTIGPRIKNYETLMKSYQDELEKHFGVRDGMALNVLQFANLASKVLE